MQWIFHYTVSSLYGHRILTTEKHNIIENKKKICMYIFIFKIADVLPWILMRHQGSICLLRFCHNLCATVTKHLKTICISSQIICYSVSKFNPKRLNEYRKSILDSKEYILCYKYEEPLVSKTPSSRPERATLFAIIIRTLNTQYFIVHSKKCFIYIWKEYYRNTAKRFADVMVLSCCCRTLVHVSR